MGVILLSDPAMFISIFISMFIYVMGGGGLFPYLSTKMYQKLLSQHKLGTDPFSNS